MTRRYLKQLEAPSGTGEVLNREQHLATARYHLRVQQEILVAEDILDPCQELEGIKRVGGFIEVIDGERWLMAEGMDDLRLRLEDGRSLRFVVKNGDLVRARYDVAPRGGLEGPEL